MKKCGGSGAIYGLGVIGAMVYYLQHATTIWEGIVGIGKAFFWPAFILFRIMELLNM